MTRASTGHLRAGALDPADLPAGDLGTSSDFVHEKLEQPVRVIAASKGRVVGTNG